MKHKELRNSIIRKISFFGGQIVFNSGDVTDELLSLISSEVDTVIDNVRGDQSSDSAISALDSASEAIKARLMGE